MTEQEKMEELVDVLEMDLGEFDRIFHASEIAVCKTVGDLMDMMHV